jgi:hypothetical protein
VIKTEKEKHKNYENGQIIHLSKKLINTKPETFFLEKIPKKEKKMPTGHLMGITKMPCYQMCAMTFSTMTLTQEMLRIMTCSWQTQHSLFNHPAEVSDFIYSALRSVILLNVILISVILLSTILLKV